MKKLILAIACLLASASSHAQERPELIGGTPVDKKDFPAVVYSSMGNARCSSTVVGPRTLFIAAHCVSNGGAASFTGIDGASYRGICTHAPQYDQKAWQRLHDELLKVTPSTSNLFTANSTADWTLCKLDKTVTGTIYETVETKDEPFQVGDAALLCGYGCVAPGGGGGNDGILRIGRATVQSLPSGSSNDVTTKGKAALCFGDSGGPLFCTKGSSTADRTLCGINSRGNISDTSYLSAVFTPMAKAFIKDWKAKNNEAICGYDSIQGCRGSHPPGPVQFTVESADVTLTVTVQPEATYSSEDAKAVMQAAINSLGGK